MEQNHFEKNNILSQNCLLCLYCRKYCRKVQPCAIDCITAKIACSRTKLACSMARMTSVRKKWPAVQTKWPAVRTKLPTVWPKWPAVRTKWPQIRWKWPAVRTKWPASTIINVSFTIIWNGYFGMINWYGTRPIIIIFGKLQLCKQL